jgi:hypothetical protein
MGMPPWDIKYDDPRLRFSRHILYNLTRPEKSLQILAPLARDAGGLGICAGDDGIPVFNNVEDPDYGTLLAAIRRTKEQLDEISRFDMPTFRPTQAYVREMKRFGVLPQDFEDSASVDTYALDRAYWESLWWNPEPAAMSMTRRP